MKEENQIKIVKITAGCFLATIYALTGANGMLIFIACFLLGVPIEEMIKRKKEV